MKMVLSYSVCFLFVILASCCPPDDRLEYVEYESEIPDVAMIDGGKINFFQGETLYLEVNIPESVVSEDGKSINLHDDLGVISNHLILTLSKKGSFSNPAIQVLSENEIDVERGDVFLDEYDEHLSCYLLHENKEYTLRFGILLKEKGDFVLSQHRQTEKAWVFYFNDENHRDNTNETVIVKSPLTTAGSTNLGLEFTVN